jgi:hypothetical protein
MISERRRALHGWKFHPRLSFQEPSGLKIVDACYSRRYGSLFNPLILYIFPDGQIVLIGTNAPEELKNQALRDARMLLSSLTDRLKSGNS